MHRSILLALVLVFATACSGGDDTGSDADGAETTPTVVPATTAEAAPAETNAAEEPPANAKPQFVKADLAQIALQPRDAPEGWTYAKTESGARTLLDAGIVLDDQVAQVRNFGLVGIRDAIFDTTTKPEQRLSTRVWLFARPRGAHRWLEKSRNDLLLFEFDELEAPQLGDDSWAARGEVDGNKLISHGFRLSNAVVVVTLSSQAVEPREADAFAAAQRAVERAKRA